jgi:hypothetical protein
MYHMVVRVFNPCGAPPVSGLPRELARARWSPYARSRGAEGLELTIDEASERPSLLARRAVAEVIQLQRRIFVRQRRLIESSEAHQTPGFGRYRNEYRRAVSGYLAESGFGALCDAVAEARIAYVADYHTHRLAQKTLVTLVRAVQQQVENIVIATEFVHKRHQAELERFLAGRISEATFLRRIRYLENWPYDIWPNFKQLFDLAAEQGIPMAAIDTDYQLPLPERDRLAAAVIARAAAENPDATVIVSVGQMHVAPSHLPAKVDLAFIRAGLPPPERVIVYQNAEEIYWQLAAAGSEGVEVVQVGQGEYCVNNTPPLVQQLSYLHWIRFDEELIEYTQLESTVRSLIADLARYLGLEAGDAAKRIRVLMPGDLELLDVLDDAGLKERERRQILRRAEAEESVCVPSLGLVYLATLSVNHAAEEAAHYLKHVVSGGLEPEEPRDLFYFIALNEACAFFASKVVNPKRKADHPGRLRAMVAQGRRRRAFSDDEAAAAAALEHLAWEGGAGKRRGRSSPFARIAKPAVFNAAAHLLGYILGDKLYYGLTAGVVQKAAIRDLFRAPLDGDGEALAAYLELSEKLRGVRLPRRI